MPDRLKGRTLLVVEDEFLILLDLQYILEDEGAEVVTATTVEEGLEAVNDAFAAALLDVRLPDGDVFPVADELSRRSVPLVFHSGHAQADAIAERFPGATTLSKPAPEMMVVDALAKSVGSERLG